MSSLYRFGRRVPPHERRPVAWYAPSVLLHAARELVNSENFLRNFDRRETFARDGQVDLEVIDLSDRPTLTGRPFVFDFLADTGDGGNATYAVAQAALAPTLDVINEEGRITTLPEGEFLIFGGDLAYPGASPVEYQYRFLEVFEMARDPRSRFSKVHDENHGAAGGTHKFVAAIPQNHDWFDSAATFCRYFVNHDKGAFLGTRTPQAQTYFAARLPEDWWILGFDWALSGDLDRYQFEAFVELARRDLGPRSDVVLLYPEPYWTRELGDGAPDGYPKRYQRLEALIEATGARIRVRLAGDQHHYHRESMSRDARTQLDTHLIVCGSGGAFAHPTHCIDVQGAKELDRAHEADVLHEELAARVRVGRIGRDGTRTASPDSTFHSEATYPTADVTRRLARRQLLFTVFRVRFSRSPWTLPWQQVLGELLDSNFGFALALGLLYGINAYVNSFVFSWSFAADGFGPMTTLPFWDAMPLWLNAMVFSPLATGVNLMMLAGCIRIAWEGPGPAWSRTVTGIAHGLVHGYAVFSLYWLATHSLSTWSAQASLLVGLASWVLTGLAGVLVGGLLFGAYLCIMSGWFGQLPNNAFGALAIEDWKGFLRMRMNGNAIEVYMLGLDAVPRASEPSDGPAQGWHVVDSFVLRKS